MTAASSTSEEPHRSPLHDRHIALSAKLADFGGWEMPIEYPDGGVLKEHAAVRESVGLFDVSHLGKMQVRGPGARAFVNSQFTNDLGRITSGHAQYSMLCNDAGGVIDDLIVYLRSDDEVFVVPNAANTSTVVDALRAAAPAGVDVRNQHRDFAVLAVQGPRADAVLERVGLPHGHPYMAFVETTYGDAPVIVCRTGYTGERGYEVLPPWDHAGALWDALAEAVASEGGRPAGLGARDTLRTEMGYPLHGQDLSPEITPVQARLGWAVGWDKPDFAGRQALLDERSNGPRRRLWGVRATDRGIPRPHMRVMSDAGDEIGEITSGTFSPTLRVGIGLALLDAAVEPGASVSVDVRGRPSTMTVVRPPFVDRAPN
ncbi:MAG TPA: glycine cleavage system aminomethyltransferase GcvT [Actinomycetes bacterium]|nr:glycine cleavage system aminomethyltransferase GcvT [Actinomycetes bacterium]